jgi:hypothetical protein
MNKRVVKKIRKEIRHQYWKYFSRKPKLIHYFLWEYFFVGLFSLSLSQEKVFRMEYNSVKLGILQ